MVANTKYIDIDLKQKIKFQKNKISVNDLLILKNHNCNRVGKVGKFKDSYYIGNEAVVWHISPVSGWSDCWWDEKGRAYDSRHDCHGY